MHNLTYLFCCYEDYPSCHYISQGRTTKNGKLYQNQICTPLNDNAAAYLVSTCLHSKNSEKDKQNCWIRLSAVRSVFDIMSWDKYWHANTKFYQTFCVL